MHHEHHRRPHNAAADHSAHDHAAHSHGHGPIGWLRTNLGHSHAPSDKIDSTLASSARGIFALKLSLIVLSVTAALQLVIVILSGSVALLADTIHNFSDATTSIPLWIAFAMARRGRDRRFTYGYGKVEDLAGIVIVLVIFGSACVAAFEAVTKIINPQPMTNLGWVAAAAAIGFVGNEAVAVIRIKVGRRIGSAALVADGQHARIDGFTSLAVLLGVAGTGLGFPIVDPLVGIGISVAILLIVKDAATMIVLRLLDAIEPDVLARIEHVPTHVAGVAAVHQARARWIGHLIETDIAIDVDAGMTIGEASIVADEVEQALRQEVDLLGEVGISFRHSKEAEA